MVISRIARDNFSSAALSAGFRTHCISAVLVILEGKITKVINGFWRASYHEKYND